MDGKVRRYDIRAGQLTCDTIGRELCNVKACMQGREVMVGVLVCWALPLDVPHPLSVSAPVTCVSFSRDGQCVLASTLDSKLRLIDKGTGELLNTLAHLTNAIHGYWLMAYI